MTERQNIQPRIEFIDLFRAFGIILMIMGHIKFGRLFGKWIHAFHMPMFFFISGWFYKSKENVGTQILKKMHSLLLPYVCFEIMQWVILLFLVPEYRSLHALFYIFFENTYKISVSNSTFGISPIPGAMWFLTAIFFTEGIYICLDRILTYNKKLHAAIVVLVVIGMLAPSVLPFRLPWALDASFVGLGFFHIARVIMGTKAERLLHLTIGQTLACGAVFSLIILISPGINMRTGTYGWYLPFWINALGAIITGWNISRFLEKMLECGKISQTISCLLKGIGKNSIVYLCLNQTVILSVAKGLDMIGLHGIINKIPIFILTMSVLFLFEKLICETRLKVMIGK